MAGPLPQFGYQSQLAGGEVEKAIDSGPKIRQFLNALYGGAGADGERGFNTRDGVVFDKLDKLKKTPLLSDEV